MININNDFVDLGISKHKITFLLKTIVSNVKSEP